ncbi:NAD-dependent epimerase/dehydratase family protein [Paenibacillus thiaminolyticus]|uniref:NAD-dependent epimerase/dehydratase family protein n=1 Tax=Paenibacillus thiaminolyticus TaxID=49283 RepID=A0AAP9J4B2_PANTH|nr:NAD-dependent epimerase/dehydratase family protein [Paenibacillus thiaminolyticus]MCY9537145.1 NAD-dependent epimerase/dehydratase family protein [Paenibacillus thiaminolyticus]MCY9603096.1 NAD-dependent epimerase/dehydratase family protein [Paenibacillus thiaminolyticus]MCY9607926.1 NAD-dependent epimerase/dehydratase family protein [Paenibacillus thiaminolyticus]MCY9613543.1 NAD-dependent epimerase/dehydratase family protein [Paenibacillus thiaminolyticus]MCY9618705.1 NAD-dependent epimer
MKILVLGGTRFFGKKLVHKLLDSGAEVTIATRGVTPDPFGERVIRVQSDRKDRDSLQAAIGEQVWDAVYDNICYTPREALMACELFAGKVKNYIFTSTLSVYGCASAGHPESDFDPYRYPYETDPGTEVDYGEGKRQAEAVFFQRADFPVHAVRFPIVLGEDDYTRRLHFHVERIRHGEPIGIPNREAKMSFISSDEAASFLYWLKDQTGAGPVNACSNGELSLDRILAIVEEAVGRTAFVEPLAEGNRSPFGVPDHWYLDNRRAREAGFEFPEVTDWFIPLVRKLARN